MTDGSTVMRGGVRVIQGTPTAPLTAATLFLRLWKVSEPGKTQRAFATLSMARPGQGGYVVKELMRELELEPRAAVDKAVAIARRGGVDEIYLNANLDELPPPAAAAAAG